MKFFIDLTHEDMKDDFQIKPGEPWSECEARAAGDAQAFIKSLIKVAYVHACVARQAGADPNPIAQVQAKVSRQIVDAIHELTTLLTPQLHCDPADMAALEAMAPAEQQAHVMKLLQETEGQSILRNGPPPVGGIVPDKSKMH